MDFNFDNFSALIENADSTVKLTDNVIGVAKSIKQLLGSSKTSGNPELEALVIELMGEVMDAKLANVELKSQLLDFHRAAIEEQAKSDEFARYELWQTATGSVVYRLKANDTGQEPTHYLCPTCKEKGVKSILQGHDQARQCTSCDVWYRFDPSKYPY